jgi:hypothetical protein
MPILYSQTTKHDPQTVSKTNGSVTSSVPVEITSAPSGWDFDAHTLIIFSLIVVTAFVIFAALRFGGDYY